MSDDNTPPEEVDLKQKIAILIGELLLISRAQGQQRDPFDSGVEARAAQRTSMRQELVRLLTLRLQAGIQD